MLDKAYVQTGQPLPGTFIETLEKKPAFISENPWFNDNDIGDDGCNDMHSEYLLV
jgi:hypothetical protein